MTADHDAITEIEERYVAATNASDVREFEDLYTEDGILMLPDRPAVEGREAIGHYLREFFKSISARMAMEIVEIEVHGSVAYCRGVFAYAISPKYGGEAVKMRGKFINLFKKDEIGQWTIWRNIYNTDHPVDD
ncbi:MAG: SgcJ/EcaC family oxidoreductase [Dehalococcoidia bacterium]|nr:SgcJ/EcaC family oxidoreductase [Dehalococcoidia bacterium]